MNYKKILSLFSFVCLFNLTISTTLQADDDFDLDELSANLDDIDRNQLRSCEPGEADIWDLFITQLNIPQLFDEVFYKSTALPPYRNPINFPNFFIFSYQDQAPEQMTFHFFWNQTNKRNFVKDEVKNCSKRCKNHTESGKRLGSYINIENGTFISTIAEAFNKIDTVIPPDLDVMGPYLNYAKSINYKLLQDTLANAQLQERRIGFLGHYFKQMRDDVTFEAKLPFFWQIRNINFTDFEKEAIRTALASPDPTLTTFAIDELEFGKNHLIFDALGTGTLDLTVKKRVYEKDNKQVWMGASLYLPTDGHLTQGLYGTYFEPCDQQPILHLCDLVKLGPLLTDPNDNTANPDLIEILQGYYTAALHHFSSMVLQCPMGYNKHLAAAAQVLPYWQINEKLEYSGTWIFEYIAPKSHPRFFINKESSTKFSDEYTALADSEEKINLLQNKMAERLFPRVYMTRVSPGFLFNTITNFQFHHKAWNFTLGYNAWYRSKEKLSHIKAPYADLQKLDIDKATTQSSTQVKLFGKIHRNIVSSYHHHNVSLSLFGNATIYNDNHGHDFTIGLSFDKLF